MCSHLFILGCLLAGFPLISRILSRLRPDRRLPPRPKGIPILGNIFDFPPPGVPEFEHWLHRKDTYGSISSVTVLGKTVVIFHDVQATRHILDNESGSTSGRPRLEFVQDLCGFGKSLASMQNNNALREHRLIVFSRSVPRHERPITTACWRRRSNAFSSGSLSLTRIHRSKS